MAMTAVSEIGLVTAFLAGMISFLSPCVLPLVPGYISYVSGVSGTVTIGAGPSPAIRLSMLMPSGAFVLGFSTVFVALGASATLLSRLLLSYRYETNIIGGVVVVLFGIVATGLVSIPWFERDIRYHGNLPSGRLSGAYMLGLAFGFGWTPCIGPVLGAILTVSAVSETATAGILLLTTYSLGLGIPFLLSAAFTEGLMRRMGAMRRTGRYLKIGAGAVMIAMGIAMMSGYMSVFSYWLLENFPMFSTIG
jgi:cytochrome c-type biogenesis protein